MSKFCPSCGAQMSDEQNFCTSCGAQVRMAQATDVQLENDSQTVENTYTPPIYEEPPMAPIPPKKSKAKLIVIIAVIAAVFVAAAAVLYFVDPFGFFEKDGDKDKNSKSSSDKVENEAYQSLVKAFEKMEKMDDEDIESILLDLKLKMKQGGQSVDIDATIDMLAPESKKDDPTVYMEMEISVAGESMDMQMLRHDGMQYTYSDGMAMIEEADTSDEDSDSIDFEGIEEMMDLLKDADKLTFDDFYDMLEDMDIVYDIDIDDKGLDKAKIDALSIINSKIKVSQDGEDTLYKIDVNLKDLMIEIADEFAKKASDKDALEEIYDEINDELPDDAEIKVELLLSKDFIKNIELEISGDGSEMELSVELGLNKSKLTESDIKDFIALCEENEYSYDDDYGYGYEDDYYFDDDYGYGYDYMSRPSYF